MDFQSSPFHFYIKFAKPLVLNLPRRKDRIIATAWVRRLLKEDDENTKTNYLKLLLLVLQSNRLKGIFLKHPLEFETLPPITEELKLECQQPPERKLVPEDFLIDYSGDLHNYVALQNINNFGVHGFYAFSKEPLYTWSRFDAEIMPKHVSKPEGAVVTTIQEEEPVIKLETEEITPEEKKIIEFKRNLMREKNVEKYASLVKPIGIPAIPDDRLPPTWGSNLLTLKEFEKEYREQTEK